MVGLGFSRYDLGFEKPMAISRSSSLDRSEVEAIKEAQGLRAAADQAKFAGALGGALHSSRRN